MPAAAAFTLAETMMGAVAVTAALVGLMQVILSGSAMLRLSRNQAMAAEIIRREIEKAHHADWVALPAEGTSAFTPDPGAWPAAKGLTGARFLRTVTVVNPGVKKITYTVSWRAAERGDDGYPCTRSGSTTVDEHEPHDARPRS